MSSPELTAQWKVELKEMTDRIASMRKLLRQECEKVGAPGSWEFVTSQYGMFAMTPLTPEQCERLAVEFHIYMTSNGRISVAGITKPRVGYLANAIKHVMTTAPPQKAKL